MKVNKVVKKCSDCGKSKPLGDFYDRNNYRKTGTVYKKPMCKECEKLRIVKWQNKNREKYNQYQKEYARNHRKSK